MKTMYYVEFFEGGWNYTYATNRGEALSNLVEELGEKLFKQISFICSGDEAEMRYKSRMSVVWD